MIKRIFKVSVVIFFAVNIFICGFMKVQSCAVNSLTSRKTEVITANPVSDNRIEISLIGGKSFEIRTDTDKNTLADEIITPSIIWLVKKSSNLLTNFFIFEDIKAL